MGTPPAEVDITEDLIRRLIEAQCPRLGGDIRIVSHGWDNVTARIGEAHAARLPRRRQAVPLIRHEQRWLPGLAARLDIAIPVPLFAGSPGSGYPWPWSIVAWIDGETAEGDPLSRGEAAHFGHFLANLHAPAPPDAPPKSLSRHASGGSRCVDPPTDQRCHRWRRRGLGGPGSDRGDLDGRTGRDAVTNTRLAAR